MRTGFWRKSMYFLFSVLIGPAVLLAYSPAPCGGGKPTPESYKWNFPKEASQILNQIKIDSYKIRDSAAQLRVDDRTANLVGWQAEADLLNRLRYQVNRMDSTTCRLRTIAPVTTPQQQQAIKAVLPEMIIITDEAQSAIRFLNNNHFDLWAPRYREYAVAMYDSANLITRDLQNLGGEHMAMRHQNPQGSKS
jgi:hypothetical protein